MRMDACAAGDYKGRLDLPRAFGSGEHYKLSSLNLAIRLTISFDSPAMNVFIMDTSIVTLIVYCISNNRGLSLWLLQKGFEGQDGEIKFHQDKPEGDTSGWPQSHAPSGLASYSFYRSSHV